MQKPIIPRADLDALWTHFYSWSGGFAPESEYQITVYLDYAKVSDYPDDVLRRILTKWMNLPDYFESRKVAAKSV